MEEKAEFETGPSQIVGHLADRTVVKHSGGFYFDYEISIDDHIETLAGNFFPFVKNWNRHFATDLVATILKLACKRGDIDMFQKPKSERVVHLEECSYDRKAQSLMNQLDARHSARSTNNGQNIITHPPQPPPLLPSAFSAQLRVLRDQTWDIDA